ncbi:MAG TPA: hypothetical protein VFM91_08475, partial [Propionibacteriaceae bacterium]|nr:hypothetical protein [Propionibacteriaceae bacterium]
AIKLFERESSRNEVTVGLQRPRIRNRPTKSDCLQRAVERSTRIISSVEPLVELAGDVKLAAI